MSINISQFLSSSSYSSYYSSASPALTGSGGGASGASSYFSQRMAMMNFMLLAKMFQSSASMGGLQGTGFGMPMGFSGLDGWGSGASGLGSGFTGLSDYSSLFGNSGFGSSLGFSGLDGWGVSSGLEGLSSSLGGSSFSNQLSFSNDVDIINNIINIYMDDSSSQGLGMLGAASYLGMPGPFAMGVVGMSGSGSIAMDDNTIEVAGTGMGQDKSYKMLPGEMLAVYSVLNEATNEGETSLSLEDMQEDLLDEYGIEAEIKTDEETGMQTLVNKSTGNTIISDSNGNNLMESTDMDFTSAFEELGLNIEDYQGEEGQEDLERLLSRMGIDESGMSSIGSNPFESSGYGGIMGNSQQMEQQAKIFAMAIYYSMMMEQYGYN
ncbi:MAG: hypothetical protein RDV48_23580 [Candidatus Eremiobacteraeota bacterium]|nr:hypothetical protein [Candidatus Eremiobacteraeota bacterium]